MFMKLLKHCKFFFFGWGLYCYFKKSKLTKMQKVSQRKAHLARLFKYLSTMHVLTTFNLIKRWKKKYKIIKIYKNLLNYLLRASPALLSILSSHVESSPHVESHFFNFTPTNSLFYLYFYYFILTFFFSLLISLFFFVSPPRYKPNIQNPTTTTTPPSCKQQT